MKHLKTYEGYEPLLILTGSILAIKLLSKLSSVLKTKYYKSIQIPDERAQSTDDNEISNELYTKLKEFINLSRNANCQVYQKDNILTVNVVRGGKMSLLFTINKDTNILKTEFGNKIRLTSDQVDEIDNLVYWYKK